MKAICQICGREYGRPPSKIGNYCNAKCCGKSKIGISPWNKGKTRNEDKRIAQPWLGKKRDSETNEKIRLKKLGATHQTEETRKQISIKLTGREIPLETRLKISNWIKNNGHPQAGDKHWNWKGGICNQNNDMRRIGLYQEWRKAIFKRDDYTCQICGKRGGRLEAHHKKTFVEYPELRFSANNGITLCYSCHSITKKARRPKAAASSIQLCTVSLGMYK